MIQGRIEKSIGGFYYVNTGEETIECRARGIFRKRKTPPLVGDQVLITKTGTNVGSVDEIIERKNWLIRPPVANLDAMVMVVSTVDPVPNYVTVDKFLAVLESHNIPVVIALTKMDQEEDDQFYDIYQKAGYEVFSINYTTSNDLYALEQRLKGNLSAFAGNSGAGKSTLLNALDRSLEVEVGETSKKLGRGRHTTRHVEIFQLRSGLEIADTPGFSSLDIVQTGEMDAQTLADCFIEIPNYAPNCRFRDCRHIKEAGCAVKEAVERKEISASRYESYRLFYQELNEVNAWEKK